jgi:type IV pilus assembly protein PilV
MKPSLKPSNHQSGFSMIEVLVTLVILLVGLLGLAGMMLQSQRSEMESYQRVQALVLLQDMVGRINANRKAARCYAITTTTNGSPYLGNSSTISPPVCDAAIAVGSTTAQQARAVQDMTDWNNLLLGTTESTTSGTTTNIGAMIGARGCVSYDTTTDIYLVSVAWQGMGNTAVPPAAWNCATSQYGTENDGLRRVVGLTLKIAKLD